MYSMLVLGCRGFCYIMHCQTCFVQLSGAHLLFNGVFVTRYSYVSQTSYLYACFLACGSIFGTWKRHILIGFCIGVFGNESNLE